MSLASVGAAWRVLKAGEAVADPGAWKRGQITANAVVVFIATLVALARSFGYDLHLDDATIGELGTGLFAFVNWLFTAVANHEIGFTGRVASAPVAGPDRDGASGRVPPTFETVGSNSTEPVPASQVRTGYAAPTGPTGYNMP